MVDKFKFIKELQQNDTDGIALIITKNADYSNEDPFSNFKHISVLTGVPVETVILMFVVNKLSRLQNVLKNKKVAVKDEKVADTIVDARNYLNILLVYLESNNGKI